MGVSYRKAVPDPHKEWVRIKHGCLMPNNGEEIVVFEMRCQSCGGVRMKDYYLNKEEILRHNNRPKYLFETSTGQELRTFEIDVLFNDETGESIKRHVPEHVADDEELVYLVGSVDPFIIKGV